MNSPVDILLASYPTAEECETFHRINEDTFQKQVNKNVQQDARGGAFGVVWTDLGRSAVALVYRANLLSGWALPGGTVQPGETFDEALRREIDEELGITVDINGLLQLDWRTFQTRSQKSFMLPFAMFEATASDGQVAHLTEIAKREGLSRVQTMPVSAIPPLIFQDENYIDLACR